MNADRTTHITHNPVGLDAELRASRDATVLALEAARDRQRGVHQEGPEGQEAAHEPRRHPAWHDMGLTELDTY